MRAFTIRSVVVAAITVAGALGASGEPLAGGVHAGQPALRGEHQAMLDLVPVARVTDEAVRDGSWSAAATWKGGRVPAAGAQVWVPAGVTVTVDGQVEAAVGTVRVDGGLRFANDRDTALSVDTIVVAPGGSLVIGEPNAPVKAGVTARVTFTDAGEIDTTRDPALLGRGLISHGTVSVCGAAVTTHAPVAGAVRRGESVLRLDKEPSGWKAGDRLVLTGTSRGGGTSQDEVLQVAAVRGAEVTVTTPVAFDHLAPAAGLSAYVAHLTRNVVFASANRSAASRAGHVMFMHSQHVRLAYAAFEALGRTDKLKPINDPVLDGGGALVAGTGSNPRGRYAVHFHRTGTDAASEPARVTGCAVVGSPGWGYVNHSSDVEFEDDVAFDVAGAAFVTEAGDEIGAFRRNIAIRSRGSGQDEDERHALQDFGHEGDGFWFQGGGVTVEGNVAAGQAASGFIYFTKGLDEPVLGRARYAVANLWNPAWATTINHVDHKDPARVNDAATVPVIAVPVRSFKDNVALACGTGFTTRFMSPSPARSVLRDSVAWNCNYGARVRYTTNLDLVGLKLISGPGEKATCGIFGTLEGEQDIRYAGLTVQGWPVGIHVPEAGHHVIEGGIWDNAVSILVPTPLQRGRVTEIRGDVRFGGDRAGQWDVYMDATFAGLLGGPRGYRDPNVLFAPDVTTWSGRQVYYEEQAAGAVPFGSRPDAKARKRLGDVAGSLPGELLDRTNQELWRQYHLALGGAVAPDDARAQPRVHGLVGSVAEYPVAYRPAVVRTEQRSGFELVAYAGGDKAAALRAAAELREGWNVVSGTGVDGAPRSFVVFCGEGSGGGKKAAKN